MPYITKWLLKPRIIRNHLSGVVTWDDIQQSHDGIVALTDNIETPVHIIIDALEIKKMAVSEVALRYLFDFTEELQAGWFFVIAHDDFANFLNTIASHLPGVRLCFVNSIDEALVQLKQLATEQSRAGAF